MTCCNTNKYKWLSQNIKNTLLPIDIFSIKNRNFVLVNLLVNKDIIFPKTMGLNRTFMELKYINWVLSAIYPQFKSHLYGIEICSTVRL